MGMLRRKWINQPSTLQVFHKYHRQNVLHDEANDVIYFTSGDIISCQLPRDPVLSPGWLPPKSALPRQP